MFDSANQLLFVCSFTLSLGFNSIFAAEALALPGSQPKAKSTNNKVQVNLDKSGAEEGVLLLERIFGRVGSIPQIAFAKSNSVNQAAKEKKDLQPGSVDYSLAIRPKDSGKAWVTPSPSLQIMQNNNSIIASRPLEASPLAGHNFTQEASNSSGVTLGRIANNTAKQQASESRNEGPETWKAGQLARGTSNSAELKQLSKDDNNRLGFWEKDKESRVADSVVLEESSNNHSSNNQNPPSLANTVDKLYGLSKKMEELQKSALLDQRSQISSAASEPAKYSTCMPATQAKRAAKPVSLDLAARQKLKKAEVSRDAIDEASASSGLKNRERNDLIALLPPNVATGIPLVSLGSSQVQVSSALSRLGKLKEQKVNDWTVLSWKRDKDNNTALQLFFRHGLLDAIRIFDRSLIAQDFGVSPGDDLESVKQKFGEPSFLIQEPQPGAGQNYIYPINRAGFQLARKDSSPLPRVISVLIFSVK